jgi:penicillin-binding protein 1A
LTLRIFPKSKKTLRSGSNPRSWPTTSRKQKSSFFLIFIKTGFVLGIWGISILLLGALWFSHDLPELKDLQATARKPSITLQTQDGTIIGTYGDMYEDMLRVQDLPPYVSQAVMAVEDRRFYSHFGIDVIGLLRAAYTNYRANRIVQGGSTITQQLAKNFLQTQGLFNTSDKSLKRKIQEVLMALWLEWKFTKDQILTMYLNRVYFGSGTFGVDAAARRYFDKSARELTVYEAAVIAGLLKAPSKYSPAQHPEKARTRAKLVLELMVESGFLREGASYLNQSDQPTGATKNETEQSLRYFTDWIYESIPNLVSVKGEDLVVVTTLDLPMQRHAESSAVSLLQEMGPELKTNEIALVAMTPSGEVKAMVGGRNYGSSQFNGVTQANRQPGSAFKFFIYLAALEEGLTPETMIDDSPVEVGNWKPSNYKWITRGEITMEDAFAYSVNAVTVRLTQHVTPQKVVSVARRLGITSNLTNDLSISLGTGEVTLLELTSAYATCANEGKAVWPYGILEIRNKRGDILYSHQETYSNPVIAPLPLQSIRQLLAGVVQRGSGRATKIGHSVSGKTGSNGDIDAWFIGYRENLPVEQDPLSGSGYSNIVVGVRTGNNDNSLMAKISTGGRLPTRVAAAFFKGPNAAIPMPQKLSQKKPAKKELSQEKFDQLFED